MQFNEIVSLLEGFMESQDIFSDAVFKKILRACDVMTTDINNMMEDKEVFTDKIKFDEVIEGTLEVSNAVLKAAFGNNFSEFITAYSELLFNWNSNTFKDRVFEQLSLYMSRMAEVRNSMVASTLTLKNVEERMKDLYSWSPPAYEISKVYFEKLLEKYDD